MWRWMDLKCGSARRSYDDRGQSSRSVVDKYYDPCVLFCFFQDQDNGGGFEAGVKTRRGVKDISEHGAVLQC